jgi:hypothetical protein
MRRLARYWVLPVVALVVLVFMWQRYPEERSSSLPAFGIGPNQEIVRVEMKGGADGELVLERQEDGSWLLNEMHATNGPAVSELLTVLDEMLVRRPVSLASRQEMDALFMEHGISVRVFASAYRLRLPLGIRLFPFRKLVRSIEVGPDAVDGVGTAMRLAGDDLYYWVHLPGVEAGLRQVFGSGEDRYRSRLLLELERGDVHTVSVVLPMKGEMSYSVKSGEDGSLALSLHDGSRVQPEKLNLVRLLRFLRAFEDLYYDRPVKGQESEKRMATMLPVPFMVLQISTHAGDLHRFEFYRRLPPPEINMDPATNVDFDPDRFYILTETGEYLLAHYYFFSHVLRPVSFFLEE